MSPPQVPTWGPLCAALTPVEAAGAALSDYDYIQRLAVLIQGLRGTLWACDDAGQRTTRECGSWSVECGRVHFLNVRTLRVAPELRVAVGAAG